MKKTILLLLTIFTFSRGFSQFVEAGTFKIFRGSVAGADINFRLEPDNTYEIYVVKFWCSLCNFESMERHINQKGIWTTTGDSIKLMPTDTNAVWYMKKIDDFTLKPLFIVNREFYEVKNDSLRIVLNKMLDRNIYTELFDFKLLYETFNNGVVKNARYKLGDSKNEYLITFDKSGEVQKIEKFRNGKKTNKQFR